MKKTIISVDLALKAIQVCKYSNNTVHSNIEMTPSQFASFLANLSPSSIIFEACGGGPIVGVSWLYLVGMKLY